MSEDGLSVWHRYSRKLGGGDFDPDSGTTHAVDMGRTLCGVDVGFARNGWERNQYARGVDAAFVECRRCRRSLESSK